MDIKKLRMDMMKMKKTDPERSKVLQSVLNIALSIAKEDGNREVSEKDIMVAAKKEIKMTTQSKESGAPYNPLTFEVCESFLPKTMNEDETIKVVKEIVDSLPEKSMKMMGKVMGTLKAKYADALDGGITSKIVKQLLC